MERQSVTPTDSISIPVPNNQASLSFYLQALENVTGTATVTLSAPGFTTSTITVTVTAAGIEIVGLPTPVQAGAGEDVNWYVQAGVPNQFGGLSACPTRTARFTRVRDYAHFEQQRGELAFGPTRRLGSKRHQADPGRVLFHAGGGGRNLLGLGLHRRVTGHCDYFCNRSCRSDRDRQMRRGPL